VLSLSLCLCVCVGFAAFEWKGERMIRRPNVRHALITSSPSVALVLSLLSHTLPPHAHSPLSLSDPTSSGAAGLSLYSLLLIDYYLLCEQFRQACWVCLSSPIDTAWHIAVLLIAQQSPTSSSLLICRVTLPNKPEQQHRLVLLYYCLCSRSCGVC
jgi:hypothetical protein